MAQPAIVRQKHLPLAISDDVKRELQQRELIVLGMCERGARLREISEVLGVQDGRTRQIIQAISLREQRYRRKRAIAERSEIADTPEGLYRLERYGDCRFPTARRQA